MRNPVSGGSSTIGFEVQVDLRSDITPVPASKAKSDMQQMGQIYLAAGSSEFRYDTFI